MRNVRPRHRIAASHYAINERAEVKEQLDANTVEGKVCFFAGGSDCDHVYSHHGRIMDRPTLTKAVKMIEQEYECAEGPTFARFIKPQDAPDDDGFRDYIAEAYEDGHPHVVYG
jgi:hypothetical protein